MNKFSYINSGNKNAESTLLFLHGNSQSKENFVPILKDVSLHDYQLIALDLPGHGEAANNPVETQYSLSFLGDYVCDFIKRHSLQNVILLGHSFGGHICLRVAQNNPQARGLMIWGTPPLKGLDSLGNAFLPSPESQFLFRENLEIQDTQAFARFCFNGPPAFSEIISHSMISTDPRFRPEILNSILTGDFVDETLVLKGLYYSARILFCENDKLVSPQYFEKYLTIDHSSHVISRIKGHGHFLHLENVVLFNSLVKQYVESLNSSMDLNSYL